MSLGFVALLQCVLWTQRPLFCIILCGFACFHNNNSSLGYRKEDRGREEGGKGWKGWEQRWSSLCQVLIGGGFFSDSFSEI